ncbi:malonyl- :anthocyanidin 5-o-glucoside-6 -o-malonyltransferase-like [Hordeum vulgare]|nr:malonyl- :anthocyanidin 5-o-glucoside-6 -o-malonyltransferase-like [Hordeum vulgare]
MERVFFYRLTACIGNDVVPSAILSTLRSSFSQALRAYFLLVGRLCLMPDTFDRYKLHYRPGNGVAFTIAKYVGDVDELAADWPREVARILPPLPAPCRVHIPTPHKDFGYVQTKTWTKTERCTTG